MCPLLFWSFLKVSPVETDRKAVLSGVKQLVPRAQRDGSSEQDPPHHFLLGLALGHWGGGDIPWHGAYGTSLSSSTLFHLELRAEIEARKFFVGEQDPYWARMYREERKGGWELKEKAQA